MEKGMETFKTNSKHAASLVELSNYVEMVSDKMQKI